MISILQSRNKGTIMSFRKVSMGGNTRSYPQMERSCFIVTLDSNKHLEKVTRGGDTSPECEAGGALAGSERETVKESLE